MTSKIRSLFQALFFLSAVLSINAQVGVNILTPHPSSALQVETPPGSFKGLLTPSMTTVNRMAVANSTAGIADGLVVYDVNHRMHYYYNAGTGRWTSLSPFSLSTSTVASLSFPSGVITTPSAATTFSVGINKQNPVQALDVAGNATVSGSIASGGNVSVGGNNIVSGSANISGSLNVNGFPANALVPAGGIIMWSGTSPPPGWTLCNGSFGTPDLRGRFIVGYFPGAPVAPANLTGPSTANVNNYGAVGNTGGENAHVILLSESASHTHSVTAATGHNLYGSTFGTANIWIGTGSSQSGSMGVPAINVSQVSQGGNQPHENRPPYYVLAFIMKL